MKLANWKIGTRLGMGFALVLALMLTLIAMTVIGAIRLDESTRDLVERSG